MSKRGNNFSEYLSNIVTDATRQRTRVDIGNEIGIDHKVRHGVHFEQPVSVQNAVRKQPMHHYIFCPHEVPYWRTCSKCGRTKELAQRNADMVLRSIGGAAFFMK